MDPEPISQPSLRDKSSDVQRELTAELLRSLPHVMVHYDVQKRAVVEFGWPVIIYNALKPQKWAEHARWHIFQFPCCFCPSEGWVGDDVYTESKVEVALSGMYTGKWTATCAHNRCTYVACLDNFVGTLSITLQSYPLRGQSYSTLNTRWTTISLPRNVNFGILVPRNNQRDTSRLRRLAIMRGSSASDAALAMSKLDARFRPGLTASEFYDTFTQCVCEMVMTRPAFRNHHCANTAIDLTDSSDADNNLGQDEEALHLIPNEDE